MKRYLVLENGTVWEGEAFGAEGDVIAEVVFTTDSEYMTNFSDGCYSGQAVVQTFPLLGDYGAISEDMEGRKAAPAAYIVREWTARPSNFRSGGDIDSFMKKQGIAGLSGIDTRALCRMLRGEGEMSGMICSDPASADMAEIKAYRVRTALCEGKAEILNGEGRGPTVAAPDLGGDTGEMKALTEKGCRVIRLPGTAAAEEIKQLKPDGLLLGGGPGNAADCSAAIKTAAELMNEGLPMLGIGLGHQIMALAAGFECKKMKSGHRGCNQPVRDEETGLIYICRQNHGYEVTADSISGDKAKIWFGDINSGGLEGLKYLAFPAVSVQFSPDCGDAPRSTGYVYDAFISLMTR